MLSVVDGVDRIFKILGDVQAKFHSGNVQFAFSLKRFTYENVIFRFNQSAVINFYLSFWGCGCRREKEIYLKNRRTAFDRALHFYSLCSLCDLEYFSLDFRAAQTASD